MDIAMCKPIFIADRIRDWRGGCLQVRPGSRLSHQGPGKFFNLHQEKL